MNIDLLIKRLRRYGADMDGINDRFMGDFELYAKCLSEMETEPSRDKLRDAMNAEDYAAAFEAAHALKGLSGNLGLTPFYDTVCQLVEALRAKEYDGIGEKYSAVTAAFDTVCRLAREETGSDAAADVDTAGVPVASPTQADTSGGEAPGTQSAPRPRRQRLVISATVVGLALAVLFVVLTFVCMVIRYRHNVDVESIAHLGEISQQIQLYIEEKTADGWGIAHSVSRGLRRLDYGTDEEELLAHLREERYDRQMSYIAVYTASGGVNSDGEPAADAQELVRHCADGEFIKIIGPDVVYIVPIAGGPTYGGEDIVACSVAFSLRTFLDEKRFSSFGGAAEVYLTRSDGSVVGSSAESGDIPDNILTLLGGGSLNDVGSGAEYLPSDMLDADGVISAVFYDGSVKKYVISSPVGGEYRLRLFYTAPGAAVNKTLDGFMRSITVMSLIVIVAFALMTLLTFISFYRSKKRLFDKEIASRDRTLEMLNKFTNTALGCFSPSVSRSPTYVTGNARSLFGHDYIALIKNEDGSFRMENDDGTQSDEVRRLNEDMAGWDGHSGFHSSFIPHMTPLGTRYFKVEFYPVDDNAEEFVGIAHDATDMHRREEVTRSALEMAERSNAAKSRFLSNMSHDIRTPMNAILNMTDFALDSFSTPRKQREYLTTIRSSAEHLIGLINDVLDVSRIESGQTQISSEPFDLRGELENIAEIARPLCEAKSQTLIVDFDGVKSAGVSGDKVKFSQVMMNLISNAVKFTPERGAVRFTATELPSLRADIAELRFAVEDNGIGIAGKYIDTIFEPFNRADERRVGNIEGTGLGLSICRSYVEAMGGTIRCESEENNGSIFTVELFFHKADISVRTDDRIDRGEKPFLGRRCLVVEDNSVNQTIARTMLERLGFIVDIAPDGREGTKMFLASRPGYYDIIYMDIQMPVMDGYQAAAVIRESEHYQAKDIPIVAMTANVFAEDIEKARLAGMNGHIGKPIISLELVEQTGSLLPYIGQ